MPSNPSMRASDADRERTATLLREHHAEGRLTGEEFHERLDAAYAAKTLGDLDALLVDLPAIDLYRLPSAGLRPAPLHGLSVVEALASRWGVESLGNAGKTVWVDLLR